MSVTEGTYSLVVELVKTRLIEVGALGDIDFESGIYVYSGHAGGPGGLQRVDRHKELANGVRDKQHWHIDYLLSVPESFIYAVYTSEDVDIECAAAKRLTGEPVQNFGCSDCLCISHLKHFTDREQACDELRKLHDNEELL